MILLHSYVKKTHNFVYYSVFVVQRRYIRLHDRLGVNLTPYISIDRVIKKSTLLLNIIVKVYRNYFFLPSLLSNVYCILMKGLCGIFFSTTIAITTRAQVICYPWV